MCLLQHFAEPWQNGRSDAVPDTDMLRSSVRNDDPGFFLEEFWTPVHMSPDPMGRQDEE